LGDLSRWFPSSWSRLRIFICYARGDRELARDIWQTLTNAGHDVFIDANSLKAGTDFTEEIRNAIARADRFVFLVSKHSMAAEAYPQTELGFAEKHWPSPKGAVWPVIVDPTIDPAALSPYLRSVQVFKPKGNIVADLAGAIDEGRRVRPGYVVGTAVAAGLSIAVVALAATGGFAPTAYNLVPPQQVDFRPAKSRGRSQNGWTRAWH
jgi:hypothetical protein